MRSVSSLIAALAAALSLSILGATAQAQTPNYTTPLVLNHFLSGGSPLPFGTVCATAADSNGNPILISAPTWGVMARGVPAGCGNLTNGALSAAVNVPDACHTNASAPIYYNIAIQPTDGQGNATADTQQITAIPNVCGAAAFDLDAYQPPTGNLPIPPNTPIGYGVDGVTAVQYTWIVNNGVPAAIPTSLLNGTPFALVLSDAGTNTNWALTTFQNTLVLTPISSLGASVPSVTLADSNNSGTQWTLQIAYGALVETATSGVAGAVSQILLADTRSGAHRSLTFTNGARIFAPAP